MFDLPADKLTEKLHTKNECNQTTETRTIQQQAENFLSSFVCVTQAKEANGDLAPKSLNR